MKIVGGGYDDFLDDACDGACDGACNGVCAGVVESWGCWCFTISFSMSPKTCRPRRMDRGRSDRVRMMASCNTLSPVLRICLTRISVSPSSSKRDLKRV